jgi:hypothetical protein
MAKTLVIATARGYFASKVQNPGDRFEVTAREFSGAWMEPVDGIVPSIGATTATAPVVPVAASVPAGPVAIPADWRTMHYKHRIALAKAISGADVTADQAVGIIEAEAANRDVIARGLSPAFDAAVVEAVADDADAADASDDADAQVDI